MDFPYFSSVLSVNYVNNSEESSLFAWAAGYFFADLNWVKT